MSEENISVKTLVTKDMTREDLYYYAKHLEEREAELLNINNKLQKKAELGEHYKHLYSEVKKQKDDGIKYIKSKKAIINTDYIRIFDLFEIDEQGYTEELLRMLGEIDD